jgi:4-amino-4-deoxy-L-arabinose transferase-like glycosyltransferase
MSADVVILARQLSLPGLYYDEASHAVYGALLLSGTPWTQFWGPPIVYTIRGWKILGSVDYYVGPLQGYVALVSMYFLGISPIALRIPPIFFTICTIPFLYCLMRKRFGKMPALVTTLSFAFNPSVLLYTRIGFWVMLPVVFLVVSALYFLDKWLSTRNIRNLIIASIIIGLGIQTFITVTWFALAGLIVTLLYLRIIPRPREIAASLASFLCGVGPFLLPWLDGRDLSFFYHYSQVSHGGVNNLAYFANFAARIVQFKAIMESSTFGFFGGIHANLFNVVVFCVSFLGIIVLLISRPGQSETRRGKTVIILLFSLMFLQTPITINSLQPYHLLIFLPFSLIIVGVFFGSLWNGEWMTHTWARSRKRKLKYTRVLLLLVLCISVLFDATTLQAYQSDLSRSGGTGFWTDAVYAAAAYLQDINCTNVAALDWGLSYPLIIASAGRLNVYDVFWTSQLFVNQVNFLIRTSSDHQLCFVSWTGPLGRIHQVSPVTAENLLARSGYSLQYLKTFYQRDSTPAIMVFRLDEASCLEIDD